MANLYDLKRFDLNLLVIFECIYQQLSISKAADMLFITPSAVSQSLQRLRIQLNDPLFVRSGKGITPTLIGTNLHQHLVDSLDHIAKAINIMNGEELKKRFVVYGPTTYANPRFTKAINLLLNDAKLEVEYFDFATTTDNIDDLMHHHLADLIFSTTAVHNSTLVCQPFIDIEYILVCRKEHPRLNNKNTLEDVLQERFAVYKSNDVEMKKYLLSHPLCSAPRNIAFRSTSITSIIDIIHRTDIIGLIPKDIFYKLKNERQLKTVSVPIPPITLTLYMIYSRASLSNSTFTNIINKM